MGKTKKRVRIAANRPRRTKIMISLDRRIADRLRDRRSVFGMQSTVVNAALHDFFTSDRDQQMNRVERSAAFEADDSLSL